ncbi:MAG TPA: ABC transporter permease [Thermomicrobiales bacterium]|nr:ABC transporter permease [Thermomicrobiales bacterium]
MGAEGRGGSVALKVYTALVYLFLFAPILVVALTSFNPTGRATIPNALTTQWYSDLMEDDQLLEALWTSLQMAILTALIASVLGLMAAYGLSRYRFRGRGALQGLYYLPMLVPAVVSGVSLLTWYNEIGIDLGFFSILIAHVIFALPFTLTIILTSFAGFDTRLEEAAQDLGATPLRTFRYITLPLVMPGVIGGALIAFTLSFDEFVLTFFVAGGGVQTLPLVIYNRIRYLLSPEINAIATIVMGFSIGILLVGQIAVAIRARRTAREETA